MNTIIADGIKPTLSELEKFEEAPEGVDIELPTATRDEVAAHSFSTGDNVEVCQGELMHLQGKILSIDGNFITVKPKHEDLEVENVGYFKCIRIIFYNVFIYNVFCLLY